jgi:FkbM family methyltransferase
MAQPSNTLFCSDESMKPHIQKVFQGEYCPKIPGFFETCTILDVGANVGAFSFWVLRVMANQNWCRPTVHCYEPFPKNFIELQTNLGKEPNVQLHQAAVTKQNGTAELYTGLHNCGECSLFKGAEQGDSKVTVPTVAAGELPKADIVKLDTEGSEVDILDGYVREAGNRPTWVLLEYHGEANRNGVDNILHQAGYILTHVAPERPGRGVAFYVHRDKYASIYQTNYHD